MTSTYDVVFLVGGAVGFLAVAYKFIRLYRHGGHPRSWALTIALLYATGTAVLSAPTFAAWFDRYTGVNCFATLLECCMELGFATAALSLVTYWRFPARRACQLVWRYSKIMLAVIAVMALLFGLSSFPGSEEVDFVTRYASQPTVCAFILAYLVPTTIATVASTRGCGRAAKDPAIADVKWLRWVLRCLQIGVGFALLHLLGESFGLLVAWFGWHSLDWVSPAASAASAIGFVPGAMAAMLPGFERLKPRLTLCLERWQVFLLLRPLHRALRFVNPGVEFVAKGKTFSPHHRVRRQLLELSEWRWALAPRFDPNVRSVAERIGRERRLSEHELLATVEAAQLKAAIHSRREGVSAASTEVTQDGSGLDSEYAWWVAVAQAFRQSAVVTAALAEAGEPRSRSFFLTSGR
jgi:hypothetical protein